MTFFSDPKPKQDIKTRHSF